MASSQIVAALSRIEIFEGLAPERLARLAREAERVVFREGQSIITDGEAGEAAYLLVAGDSVRIAGGDHGEPEPVPEGSLVGEFAMLIDHVHGATVVAKGPVRAIKIPRETMHRLIAEDADLADHLVARVAMRLSRLAGEMRAICLDDDEPEGRRHSSDADRSNGSVH